MPACKVCNSTSFEKHAGFYYCTECDTQCEERQELATDWRLGTILSQVHIAKKKAPVKKTHKYAIGPEWTTLEAHNYILRGLTQQLVAVGAPESVTKVVLELWAKFLSHRKAAFISRCRESKPLLGFPYHKRDAKILYDYEDKRFVHAYGRGIVRKRSNASRASSKNSNVSEMSLKKLKRRLITSEYESQLSESQMAGRLTDMETTLDELQTSDSGKESADDESIRFNRRCLTPDGYQRMKKFTRSDKTYKKRRSGNHCHNLKSLFGILYIALLVTGSDIQLSDLLRFVREGYISSSQLSQFLPPDIMFVTGDERVVNALHIKLPSYAGLSTLSRTLISDMEIRQLPKIDVEKLIQRYSSELQLPDELALLAVKLLRLSYMRRNGIRKFSCEGMAMVAILLALKIILGLDNSTEYKMSWVADKINAFASEEPRLFSFSEWQRMIECRYAVLSEWHQPTRNVEEPSARFDTATTCDFLSKLPRDLHLRSRIAMTEKFSRRRRMEDGIFKILPQLKDLEQDYNVTQYQRPNFQPSLTPDTSNIEAIIQHLNDTKTSKTRTPKWVGFLSQNWRGRSINYLQDADYLKQLLQTYGIKFKEDSDDEWLRSHVQFMVNKADAFDGLSRCQLETKVKVNVAPTVLHSKKRRSTEKKSARWIPQNDTCHLRIDHGYWLLDTGLEYISHQVFTSEIMPNLPNSWGWLLKVGSKMLTISHRDLQILATRIERHLFGVYQLSRDNG